MLPSGAGTRYREIRQIGAGGMGTVSLGEDEVLGRPVALKRVPGRGDPRNALRLKREALVGASLNHPNLVSVYDAQLEDGGDVLIVMEYVEGQTLRDLIRSRGPLAPAEALRVLRGVAAGLDAIHEQGIVHRDVKPANVLLGRDGTVKLADLGIADVADRTRITSADAVVGSFGYMSPEQLNGEVPSRAMDVYALSAVAYEMLTGQKARPESNPLALAHAISTKPPPNLLDALPSAPRRAADVLQRGMSADPAQRPKRAGELVHRLEAAMAPERPTETAPIAVVNAPPRRRDAPPSVRERSQAGRRAPQTTSPLAPAAASRRRTSMLAPMLIAGAVLAVAGVTVSALLGGGAKRSGTHTPPAGRSQRNASAHRASGTSSAHRSTSSSTRSTIHASPPTSTSASAAGAGAGGASPTTTSTGPTSSTTLNAGRVPSTTPVSVVQRFYTAAAAHQYVEAWSLADSNLHSQLGGYPAFENQMSAVRSITFHQAQEIGGAGSNVSTVAVRTTSVQRDGTQECSGTARTVRSGHAWLLDGISISCS